MVHVFELADGQARPFGSFSSQSEATAALPSGAYTTFRTYHHDRIVRLDAHFHRLETSLALMGTPTGLDSPAARHVIAAALRAAGYPESRVRLTFAAGVPARFFAACERFSPLPSKAYEDGVRCVRVSLRRDNPHAKSTAFAGQAEAAKGVLPDGVNEGLMIDPDGTILEGLSSNFFAITADTLRTEETRALGGLTRALVMELAPVAGLTIASTGLHERDLPSVDECFITSVSREILPVIAVDQVQIGSGRPGAQTKALMALFAALVEREARPIFEPA